MLAAIPLRYFESGILLLNNDDGTWNNVFQKNLPIVEPLNHKIFLYELFFCKPFVYITEDGKED